MRLLPLGLVITLLLPGASRASWDYGAALSARSRPYGAIFSFDAGYSRLLWGERAHEWKYGFVRAFSSAESIAVANRLAAGIELYPVSFLGIRYSRRYHSRLTDRDGFDCARLACTGWLKRDRFELRAAAAAGQAFLTAEAEWEWISQATDAAVLDDGSFLVAAAGGDRILTLQALGGWKFSDAWKAGLVYRASAMAFSGQTNQAGYAFGSLTSGDWEYFAGAGAYRSDPEGAGVSLIGAIRWQGLPSPAKF